MISRSLVLLKSDAVERSVTGEILSRFEKAGFKIIGIKMFWADDDFARKHYSDEIEQKHGKEIRDRIVSYLKEGPVFALVLEGVNAIENIRKMVGDTYPHEAPPGTIRGDYAHISKTYANEKKINVKNLVHASANKEDAKIEIPLWFSDSELFEYQTLFEKHIN
ncbi:MAG: nucleoside-diphosphate kinase [Nanoarchaeota archaeon]|jgi:nucleoside-diphosphate kinase|nr:nucleoside-diphosphate kinase [Nanoarchaeota archaeon]|tara:strand:- start:19607 stop:20098 length:492 start_codon:yes stop_codon:yes gene_type:complete